MKRIFKRIIADFHQSSLPDFRPRVLEVPLDLSRIITIVGPRRAGKTTYLFQIMAELERRGVDRRQMLYLNFEDERIVLERDYDQILDAYRELYPQRTLRDVYIFFDEIQELRNWEKFVRRVFDGVSSHVFLTGSNARFLSREIATSLRGRSLSFEILPLSFKEYLIFQDISTKDTVASQNSAVISNAFEEYNLWGGFPELVFMAPHLKAQILQEYFNVMLYRDLVERYQIGEISILKFLLKRLIGSFTKEFSVNKLYNELKSRGFSIGKDSLYKMMEEIFSIYMLANVEKYDPSVIRREMSNKKVYLFDNGFATALHYSFSEDRGKRLENNVYRHLRAHMEEIYFVRNGWECDFVVFPRGCPPLLIQVAEHLDDGTLSRELKGLIEGRKLIGHADALLLVDDIPQGLEIQPWIQVMKITDWLLMDGLMESGPRKYGTPNTH